MEEIERILKIYDDSSEDELIKLIGLSKDEAQQMNIVDFDELFNKRLFEIFDQYGWQNIKRVAREKFPSVYIDLLELSDREEDIDEIKDLLFNSDKYKASVIDLKELLNRIDDLEFLQQLVIKSSSSKFIKNLAINKIINSDLSRGKELLQSLEGSYSVQINSETFDKINDTELIRLLLDNSKRFSIGTDSENTLIAKLYKQDSQMAKEYLSAILDNPTKHCVLKSKIGQYLQTVLNSIDKADNEYSSELAIQIIDRFEKYGVKIENPNEFIQYVKDKEKITEYLLNYQKNKLDALSIQTLLNKLSEIDKAESVKCAKEIIKTIDPQNVGLKMTCIISCQDTDFLKECVENSDEYGLEIEQQCYLLAQTKDSDYIIEKINGAGIWPNILYTMLSTANEEKLYIYAINNAEELHMSVSVIYKMMSEKLPIEKSIRLLKNADNIGLDNEFKQTFLDMLIKVNNPNTVGFIEKYIRNYRSNQFNENSLIEILSNSLNPRFIDVYFDVKTSPFKESELKLLLYSNDESRRNKIIDLVLSNKVPLTQETKAIATFAAYTIQDNEKRKEILHRLKVNNPRTKSQVCIPDNMTVGIEIESIGPNSRTIRDLGHLIFRGWDAKKDGSLGNDAGETGVEIASPILRGDDPEINNKISFVSNFLRNEGQTVNESCGGHVHIGVDYFKDYESFQNLVDLWVNCEQIIYVISNQIGEVPRKSIAEYAKPISKSYEKFISEGFVDVSAVNNLDEIQRVLNIAGKRCNSINFDNLSNFEKHTIEFRLPNGTINPETWIENINLFGNILKKCQDIATIRKKEKDQLTREEKNDLRIFNTLVFGDLNIDDRANVFINYIIPEAQQKNFHQRYFVNSKMLNLHSDVKEFLSSETFDQPVDLMDLRDTLFAKEGRITGTEFAICSTILVGELRKMKGKNHEYQ